MNANSDKGYIDTKVGDLRTYVNVRYEVLESKIDALRAEVSAKIETAVAQLIKWYVSTILVVIAVMIALFSVTLNAILRDKQSSAATPATVVQVTPAGKP